VRLLAVLLALAAPAPADRPSGFVELDRVDPTILHDMRYAARYNFVGRRIDGYRDPVCILHRRAARALERAQAELRPRGYSLKVYDCYRPQRAVDQFARWAAKPADDKMKREFYPHVDKSQLFDRGYIAHRSGHSRGSTVDLTLVRLPPKPQPRWTRKRFGLVRCYAPRARRYPDNSVSMGTAYDCFDPRAHTLDPRISSRPRRNRRLLKRTLERAGFEDYANEWWHFTLANERYPGTYFDFPVARPR
jgi:zinc D-Ala-D-Ala dipeptidase